MIRQGGWRKCTPNNVLTEQYQYDAFGNRTSATTSGFTYSYQYSGNHLTQYSWPQSGNIRKKEFSYNNTGQLLATVNKTDYGSSQQVTSSRSYNYNVFGNLKNVSWASQNENYTHDPHDRRVATYTNGAIKSKLVYGIGNVPAAELNENDKIINTFTYADGYTPLILSKGTVDYYLISDIRGSVRMVVKSSSGELRQKISYDAFGNILEDTSPGYTPFGFAGGLYDTRTGLLRFGARDYSPETGRWTAEDPIGFWSGDINFYAYVANDPINFVDPSGLSRDEVNGLTNHQLVHKSAILAQRAIPAMGRFAGTKKHTYAINLLNRYQNVYGSRGLTPNVYFNNNKVNGIGNRGVLDILDSSNKVIYDFKFGNAVMSAAQYNKYSQNFGYPIIIIRP